MYITLVKSLFFLSARRLEGSKYDKAIEWRKPYVNVQWLSDNVLGNIDNVRNISQLRYQTYDLPDPFMIDQLQRMPLMGELIECACLVI